MGSVTYDFLADSLLFHPYSLETKFKNEGIDRLEAELQAYRNHCIKNYNTLLEEIGDNSSSTRVFSSTDRVTIDLLKQTALYIEQFVIPDPLFKLTEQPSEIGKVTGKYLGYETPKGLEKEKLASTLLFFKNVTPMVVADFIKFFPLSYLSEAPKEFHLKMPINNNNDLLPEHIRNFFWENVKVQSLIKSKKGGWIIDNKLYPCRGIVIDFKGSNSITGMLYHLFAIKVLEANEKTGQMRIAHTLPDTPPGINEFEAWVTQSVNSASRAYFDNVYKEIYLASNLGATYLTQDPFAGKLIDTNFEKADSISGFTSNQLLNMDLPFIQNIDIQKLMDVRVHDQDVFTAFRMELEKQFRELRTLSDEKTIKIKAENIFHELNDVQVKKIMRKMEILRKQLGSNAVMGIAGLAGSVHTGGMSLLASLIAAAKGYKDYTEFNEKAKENPAYLLWRIKKQ